MVRLLRTLRETQEWLRSHVQHFRSGPGFCLRRRLCRSTAHLHLTGYHKVLSRIRNLEQNHVPFLWLFNAPFSKVKQQFSFRFSLFVQKNQSYERLCWCLSVTDHSFRNWNHHLWHKHRTSARWFAHLYWSNFCCCQLNPTRREGWRQDSAKFETS